MAAIALFYFSTLVLMLPLLSCVGIGALWAKRDLPFGGSFITTLVTSVTTPALVFHTFVTTHLDDRALADVAVATLLALLLCGLVCALWLKVWKLPVRTLLPTASLPMPATWACRFRRWRSAMPACRWRWRSSR